MMMNENGKPVSEAAEEGADAAAENEAEVLETEEELQLDLSETETLESRLKAARKEVDEMKDKVLRALAENENLRRRAQREREDAGKYAISNFARDLLSVADNLGRALDALPADAKKDERLGSFVEGVELTGRELVNVFEKHGVSEIRPHGEKFDHNLHQAMFEVEDADKPHGTVTEVLQLGYTIGDRLLRPAMVGVTKRPKPPEAPKPAEPETAPDTEEPKADGGDS